MNNRIFLCISYVKPNRNLQFPEFESFLLQAQF